LASALFVLPAAIDQGFELEQAAAITLTDIASASRLMTSLLRRRVKTIIPAFL
jgi:hypothetical protein